MTKTSSEAPVSKMRGMAIVAINDGTTARASNVKLRCGDCLHFQGTAHPSMGQSCIKLDVKKGATAPSCYTPHIGVFRDAAPDLLATLFTSISAFTPQQQRILMGMLRNAAGLERTGFSFMETVYFVTTARTSAHLSDWYRGFVSARGPGGTIQLVGINFLEGKKSACVALMDPGSLLTRKQFDKERKKLVTAGKLKGVPKKMIKVVGTDDYEAPTLDTAADFLERNANSSKKLRREVKSDQQKTWTVDQARILKSNKEADDTDVESEVDSEDNL